MDKFNSFSLFLSFCVLLLHAKRCLFAQFVFVSQNNNKIGVWYIFILSYPTLSLKLFSLYISLIYFFSLSLSSPFLTFFSHYISLSYSFSLSLLSPFLTFFLSPIFLIPFSFSCSLSLSPPSLTFFFFSLSYLSNPFLLLHFSLFLWLLRIQMSWNNDRCVSQWIPFLFPSKRHTGVSHVKKTTKSLWYNWTQEKVETHVLRMQ